VALLQKEWSAARLPADAGHSRSGRGRSGTSCGPGSRCPGAADALFPLDRGPAHVLQECFGWKQEAGAVETVEPTRFRVRPERAGPLLAVAVRGAGGRC